MAYDLGIIGGGNMAEAIVRGLLNSKTIPAEKIIVTDISSARREVFSQMGVRAVQDNASVAGNSYTVLLCVKPQQMAPALASLGPVSDSGALIISIAAGVRIKSIRGESALRVIRAMPNTPMLVGQGATAICAGPLVTSIDMSNARRIFESAGIVIETTEDKMDAVTALSGSGPAYFFYLVEQLIKVGIELGLPPDQAKLLACKTAMGSAKMLMESTEEPAELRRRVTSPGGTTEAAISHLNSAGWPAAMVEAVKAAAKRSGELSR